MTSTHTGPLHAQNTAATELQDLTRALHDDVLQPLSGASMALAGFSELRLGDRQRAFEAVTTALTNLQGLVQCAADRLERIEPVELAADEPRFSVMIRSVVAEVLANIREHAAPGHVTINVSGDASGVTLEALNDCGDGRTHRNGVGLRLASLETRCIGGQLEFGPTDDGGWRVRVCLSP